jgi:hypothetical protein
MWHRFLIALRVRRLRQYQFKMMVPGTEQRDAVTVAAYDYHEAAHLVRMMVDTSVWLIGPGEIVRLEEP